MYPRYNRLRIKMIRDTEQFLQHNQPAWDEKYRPTPRREPKGRHAVMASYSRRSHFFRPYDARQVGSMERQRLSQVSIHRWYRRARLLGMAFIISLAIVAIAVATHG